MSTRPYDDEDRLWLLACALLWQLGSIWADAAMAPRMWAVAAFALISGAAYVRDWLRTLPGK